MPSLRWQKAFAMTLLTTAEVAHQLKISIASAKRLIKKGDIPHIRILRSVRVDQAELDNWISENRVPAKTGCSFDIGPSSPTGDVS